MKISQTGLRTFLVSMIVILGLISTLTFAEDMPHQRMGTLTGAGGHHAEGSVDLQGHRLTLSNIDVDKVPDGRVYLTNDADYKSGVELGRLTQFTGTVKFSIPDEVDPDKYNSVLIWCKKFSVEIGHANLN